MSIAKTYLILLAFTSIFAVLGVLGVGEIVFLSTLSVWPWNIVLIFTFLVFPILTVSMDNYVLYLLLSGAYSFRIMFECITSAMLTASFYLIHLPLYSLAILICLGIAANKVSLEIAGEILSLS